LHTICIQDDSKENPKALNSNIGLLKKE